MEQYFKDCYLNLPTEMSKRLLQPSRERIGEFFTHQWEKKLKKAIEQRSLIIMGIADLMWWQPKLTSLPAI